MVVGDFNGDGLADLAVANQNANTVNILLGNRSGILQVSTYPVNVSLPYPSSLATGDFNGDGLLDLVVTDGSGVTLLLGTGDGTFQTGPSYAAGPGGQIAAGDFNHDGLPDLVLSNAITILLNTP